VGGRPPSQSVPAPVVIAPPIANGLRSFPDQDEDNNVYFNDDGGVTPSR
jgi:hypothetical protein